MQDFSFIQRKTIEKCKRAIKNETEKKITKIIQTVVIYQEIKYMKFFFQHGFSRTFTINRTEGKVGYVFNS